MQVFLPSLVFSWHSLSDSQASKLRMQKWWMADWQWNTLRLRPRVAPQARKSCEPSLPWYPHAPSKSAENPGLPRDNLQTYRNVNKPKISMVKESRELFLLVNTTGPVLSRLIDNSTPSHQFSTAWRTHMPIKSVFSFPSRFKKAVVLTSRD